VDFFVEAQWETLLPAGWGDELSALDDDAVRTLHALRPEARAPPRRPRPAAPREARRSPDRAPPRAPRRRAQAWDCLVDTSDGSLGRFLRRAHAAVSPLLPPPRALPCTLQ